MTNRMSGGRSALVLAVLVAAGVFVAGGGHAAAGTSAPEASRGAQADAKRDRASGIVASITKSPVSPDGNVAGARTDLVINLAGSMDPAVFGFDFAVGDVLTVTLPEGFVDTGLVPFGPGGPNCIPGGVPVCNGIVLLQGWPQYPVVPFGGYAPHYDAATRTITMTISATLGSVDGGFDWVGVKQIHLLLPGFTNPQRPGKYPIDVTIARATGGVEYGSATAEIIPQTRPSIHVTSVLQDAGPIGVPNRVNPLYQSTDDDIGLHPVSLLLWDRQGQPLVGATLAPKGNGDYVLVRDGDTVGQVRIAGPKRGDLTITAQGPSFAINSPITAIPTGRLIVEFVPGAVPGVYTVTFSLNGGNDATFVITAS